MLCVAFAAALAFDPYENEAPLGPETGCMMHSLAYEYAQHLMGDRAPEGSRRKKQLWDSLFTGDMMEEGMGNCSGTAPHAPTGMAPPTPPSFPIPATAAAAYYVDNVKGSDSNSGSEASPVKTVEKGLALVRAFQQKQQKPGDAVHLVLRAGIHALAEPLSLGPDDAGLVLQNYPGEES
eukprot:gene31053-20177_t